MVGFGSYSSVPGILAGSFLSVPILIHEQNVIPGRANQFLSFWADRIGVSFEETVKRFTQEKVIWSGFPLRKPFSTGASRVHREDRMARSTLLVLGGSQGAKRLNQVFLGAMQAISVAVLIYSSGQPQTF